jgi:inhibitor of cysteine peptidase
VALSGASSATTISDAGGNYAFTGLDNGSYTITPSKAGFTFNPASSPQTVSGADITDVDCIATPIQAATYSISGQVMSNGSGLSGVGVGLSGASSATAITDASGNYTFNGLYNGSYTVTPSRIGFTFNLANSPQTVSGANIPGVNFIATPVQAATYSISGQVTSNGSGLSGVAVALSGASSATAITGAGGNYAFTGLANGSYTITPSKAGFTFNPASSPQTVSGANTPGVNFIATPVQAATYSISGQVTSNGSGLSGVGVGLSGASSATAITDASGNYAFTGLYNGSYTVTPSRIGFTFNPASSPQTVSGANTPGVNFIATPVQAGTYSISGQVTSNGVGLSAVAVALSGADSATAYTDPNGNYVFTGLENGSYTITPGQTGWTFNAGWTFTPASSPQTVSGADIPGVNFIGNDPCFGACCGCWDY